MNWQPIETAPKDGTKIIGCAVWGPYASIDLVSWWDGAVHGVRGPSLGFACWWIDNDKGSWSPTHWMPLPEPPSGTAWQE